MKLKELAKVDLPREKMAKYGPGKLADHELLAVVLGSGIKGANVLQLSKKALKEIQATSKKSKGLKGIRGLGPVRVLQIQAALELGKRLYGSAPETVLNPEKIFAL